eukprot:6186010-Pleurochrysis_carterae.AAC.5
MRAYPGVRVTHASRSLLRLRTEKVAYSLRACAESMPDRLVKIRARRDSITLRPMQGANCYVLGLLGSMFLLRALAAPTCLRGPASRSPQELAEVGYALLAERLRSAAERAVVADVLRMLIKQATLDTEALYSRLLSESQGDRASLFGEDAAAAVWLPSTRRIYALVAACMESNEPVRRRSLPVFGQNQAWF